MRRRRYDHVVLDTPGIDPRGLKELAAGCNLLVLPAIPKQSQWMGWLIRCTI